MEGELIATFDRTRISLIAMEQAERRPEELSLTLTDTNGRTHFLTVAGPVDAGKIWHEEWRHSATVREHGQTDELTLTVWANKRWAELRRS